MHHIPLDDVIHRVPLAQILALNAVHGWGQGLDLAGPSYEDQDFLRKLAEIRARRQSLTPTS